MSDLVFTEGTNDSCIDVVDGNAKDHNNDILYHSLGKGIPII